MAARRNTNQPIIVIVGPTASGKSEAAMNIALKYDAEIICADARTVYKGLDIGTAKPSSEDRARVPHHVLDVVNPDEPFSAAKFQRLATAAIANIHARGKLPVMVGGTGLFVDGVLFGYEFGSPAITKKRLEFEAKSVEELQAYCNENNIELPKNVLNKRHLIRAIEQGGINRKRETTVREHIFVVGIAPDKETLQKRINDRAKRMFETGIINETTFIAKKYNWDTPGLTGKIYPIIHQLVDGKISKDEAITIFARADWQLARRQMTWFRRNKAIHWCTSPDEAEQLINVHLANLS